jgi:hypothetical protein
MYDGIFLHIGKVINKHFITFVNFTASTFSIFQSARKLLEKVLLIIVHKHILMFLACKFNITFGLALNIMLIE